MALFKRNFDKPGPGVPKNAPKKKGIARFFEVLARDFFNLFKLDLLLLLCVLPAMLLFVAAMFFWFLGVSGAFFWLALGALVASILVGPGLTAVYNLLTRMLRDEPGFVWHQFKKAFMGNFKATVLPGILYAILAGSQGIAVLYYMLVAGDIHFLVVAVYLFALLVFNLAAPYFFLQASYLELGTTGLLKNSLLFALGNAPRAFAGFIIPCVLLAAAALGIYYVPPLLPVLLLILPILCELIRMMWIWPGVDKTFKIDETLKARAGEDLSASLDEQGIEPADIE